MKILKQIKTFSTQNSRVWEKLYNKQKMYKSSPKLPAQIVRKMVPDMNNSQNLSHLGQQFSVTYQGKFLLNHLT